jgi:hypothetical protein
MELAADGPAAVAGFEHRVDGGVPGPDAVGEPVAPPGRGRDAVRGFGLIDLFLDRFGDEDAEALAVAVAGNFAFGGLAEVVPEMPPVGDLNRLGRPGCGAFREERGPSRKAALGSGFRPQRVADSDPAGERIPSPRTVGNRR